MDCVPKSLTVMSPGTLVLVESDTGRFSLAYTSSVPYQLSDGTWVVKLEKRAGCRLLSRITPYRGESI